MRVGLLIGCLISLSIPSIAQQKGVFVSPDNTDTVTYQNDDLLIKFNGAALLSESLQFSAEFFLKPSRISLNTDVAYLFSSKYIENENRGFFGFAMRPQIRYYARPSTQKNERWYLGLSVKYKFGQSSGEQAIGLDCDGTDNCDYFRQYDGKGYVHRVDMQFHYGLQIRIYDDFYLESDLGLGYGYESQSFQGIEGRLLDPAPHMNPARLGWGVNGSIAVRVVFVIDGKNKVKRTP